MNIFIVTLRIGQKKFIFSWLLITLSFHDFLMALYFIMLISITLCYCYFGNYYNFVINFYGHRFSDVIYIPVSIVLHKEVCVSPFIISYMYFLLNVTKLHMKDTIQ